MRAFVLSALVFCSACSSGAVDVPVASGGQLVLESQRGGPTPQIYVLVVDDTDSLALSDVRATVFTGVQNALSRHVDDSWGPCGSNDPAEWRLTDHRIVVVRPSAPDDQALVSWIDQPSQWWSSTQSTKSEVDTVMKPLFGTLVERLALPGEAYRPIRAAARTLALLGRTRPPETESEQALVDSLPESPIVNLVVASAHDDEETAPVDAYVFDVAFVAKWVIGPFDPALGPCASPSVEATRLRAWGKLIGAELESQGCPANHVLDFGVGVADCHVWCIPALPLVLPDGTASCRVTVEQPNLEKCDAERGWTDPSGGPELAEAFDRTLRVCEVKQVKGDSLEACRHELECPGCPVGFCVTEVPELVELGTCQAGKYPEPFRFIGGAIADIVHLRIACDRAD